MAASSSGPVGPNGIGAGRTGGAVLLIGASGADKGALGRFLAQNRAGGAARFLSVRDELRARGLTQPHDQAPSAARRAELRAAAEAVMREAARDWAAQRDARAPTAPPPLMLLDCVYETEDAFAVMEVLRDAGVPLLQVLCVAHSISSVPGTDLADIVRAAPAQTCWELDASWHAQARWTQWAAHAGRVLEFFSALGVLTEVARDGAFNGTPLMDPLFEDPSFFAEAGYARGPVFSTCQERDLAFTPLQPVTSPRLVTSRSERDRVLAEAARVSGLRLDGFFRGASSGGPALPEPTRALATAADARWVGWPGRYAVSRKAEGTRHLLMVLQWEGEAEGKAEAYLLNGVGTLYRFPIQNPSPAGPAGASTAASDAEASEGTGFLPPGTLLDGDLMWLGARGLFLASDALCVGGRRLWSRPLRERLAAMEGGGGGDGGGGLGLTEAEECMQVIAAAQRTTSSEGQTRSHLLRKRQQAPLSSGGGTVFVLRKRQLPASPDALRDLAAGYRCPFPTVGLVFTPYDMPYVLGMVELSYTWRPREKRVVELTMREVRSAWGPDLRPMPFEELVYECVPQTNRRPNPTSAKVVDVRWDKACGHSLAAQQLLAQAQERGLKAEDLVQAAEEAAARAAACCVTAQAPAPPQQDPARCMPFDELYGSATAAVEAGRVQRSVDPGSGLELFDCRPGTEAASEVEALCRGLVLHPPSQTVVAAPFSCLGELSPPPPAELQLDGVRPARPVSYPINYGLWHVGHRLPRLRRTATMLLLGTLEELSLEAHQPNLTNPTLPTSASGGADSAGSDMGGSPLSSASVKVDGCLVLAFTWGGQLRTATRRGMEAEQPGWSYMLEAVYGSSTHVVPYAFEGLVLLGAVDSAGLEVPRLRLPALAQELGVTLAAPSLEGRLSDLLSGLPGADPAPSAEGRLPLPSAPPAFEGWVVAAPDGRRYKLVQLSYKQVSAAGRLLHPLSVWDRVCYGGATPASLATGLPEHMRSELYGILSALSEAYGRARAEALRLLRAAAAAGQLADLGRLGAAAGAEADGDGAAAGGGGAGGVGGAAGGGGAGGAAATELQALLAGLQAPNPPAQPGTEPAAAGAGAAEAAPPAGAMPAPLLRALTYAARTPIRRLGVGGEGGGIIAAGGGGGNDAPIWDADCVQPAPDGSLRGYTPSPAFAHSWARAWAQGPVGRMDPSAPPPLIHTALLDELLERCLAPLEGPDLVAALLVCSKWRRVLKAAPPPGDLASRLRAGWLAQPLARRVEQALPSKPLRERLAAMEDGGGGLGLTEAEECRELRLSLAAPRKEQQAPTASSIVCVLRKRQLPASPKALRDLAAGHRCPYSINGLVFTPYDMPYALGMAELSYTWQPRERVAVHLTGLEVQRHCAGLRPAPLGMLVYECVPDVSPAAPRRMKPLHICWDQAGRSRGSAEACINQLWQTRERGLTAEELVHAAEKAAAEAAAFGAAAQPPAPQPHPARRMPFDELYGSVMAAVEAGGVERSVDPGSGLELFDCRPGAEAASEVEALCRGLVLHPPSRTVVAAPFGPLGELSRPPPAEPAQDSARPASPDLWGGWGEEGHPLPRLPHLTATLLPETEAELRVLSSEGGATASPDASDGADTAAGGAADRLLSCASVKVDGSLVLAFTWGGQALWAGDWLRRNANPAAFQPGWSYMLEAVYGSSTHVVPYAFEGLVLLGAVDSAGLEVPRLRLPALAQELGVTLAAPSLEGRLSDLLSGLSGADPAPSAEGRLPLPSAPPAFEGWVVAAPDGRRYKLVQLSYKQVSAAGRLLHPLSVWDRVCYGGATPASLATGLPGHMRSELYGILSALSEAYGRARAEALRLLRAAAAAGQLADLGRLGAAVASHGADAAGGEAGADGGGGGAGGGAGGAAAAELQTLLAGLQAQHPPAQQPGTEAGAAGSGGAEAVPPAAAVPAPLLRVLTYAAQSLTSVNHVIADVVTFLNRDDALPQAMYYDVVLYPRLAHLRRLLLRCVQPAPDGSLRGYTPSPAFAHAWARGWAQGPVGRMDPSAPPPLIHTALLDELLERCLAPLEGFDVVAALLVCCKWRRVLKAAPPPGDLASRLADGRWVVEDDTEEMERDRFDDSFDDEYGDEYDGDEYGDGDYYDMYAAENFFMGGADDYGFM
ncbi:hypothetical protein HYH03_005444 [Edaphochlamys debaryana]|uniref:F-box domain-containing protein n=1 Tax=Edaphochlamys debaryana TaxID=47281 RepID=A0A835Y5Y9_9CHLO|nr:hypothetical protein HYH03_005444 [Edaphochlamys debaryana]|eukprot:KAG2496623.1 hypothetical protein HYH03_005444 [Edaphochlamys debaryana]